MGGLGWPEPVQVDSGNGYCDYYALPGLPIPRCPDPDNPGCLKYDAANDTLIRDVIHALGHKFSNALGSIDDAVFNPSQHHESTGHLGSQGQALGNPTTPRQQNPVHTDHYNTGNRRATPTGGGPTSKTNNQDPPRWSQTWTMYIPHRMI